MGRTEKVEIAAEIGSYLLSFHLHFALPPFSPFPSSTARNSIESSRLRLFRLISDLDVGTLTPNSYATALSRPRNRNTVWLLRLRVIEPLVFIKRFPEHGAGTHQAFDTECRTKRGLCYATRASLQKQRYALAS